MTENNNEIPAQDEGDEDVESVIGEEVEPDHDLNIEDFEDDEDDEV